MWQGEALQQLLLRHGVPNEEIEAVLLQVRRVVRGAHLKCTWITIAVRSSAEQGTAQLPSF